MIESTTVILEIGRDKLSGDRINRYEVFRKELLHSLKMICPRYNFFAPIHEVPWRIEGDAHLYVHLEKKLYSISIDGILKNIKGCNITIDIVLNNDNVFVTFSEL